MLATFDGDYEVPTSNIVSVRWYIFIYAFGIEGFGTDGIGKSEFEYR